MMSRRRRRWWFYRDTLPLIVIIGTQCSDTALSTLFKAATDRGMSHHVFVAYAYALATTLLLPYLFFFKRSSSLAPPISFSILIKIVLLGVLGSSSQVLGYAGINYSSPALASSISNLLPAFTFLLAIAFRMEKVAAKSRSSQAKVVGSIVSIAGAFVVTFYKGPSVNIAHSHLSLPTGRQIISIPNSVDTTWVIAGALLTADYLLVSLCYIWQIVAVLQIGLQDFKYSRPKAEILKEYPDELTVVFFYNVTATIVSVTVALFTEPSASAWEIGLDISLVSIICSGIFGKLMSNAVNAWALHLKGAVYVATFQPLSIVIATAMGVVFLCDTLHIGSIIGAVIISIGFYTVLWGKATEEKEEDFGNQESETIENVPLLQSYKTVN